MGESKEIASKQEKKSRKKWTVVLIIFLLLVVVGVILFFAFFKKRELITVKKEPQAQAKYRMSGNQLEDFDLRFLQLEENGQNIVYSPLLIKYALAMLSEGAREGSKEQIDALIGDYKAKKYINSSHMSFANAMFIRNTFKESIKESYITNLGKKYNAEVIYDGFDNPDHINSWVNEKTLGLIDRLVDDVSGSQFYLINALAIDMDWNKLIQATIDTYKDEYHIKYAHENYSAFIPLINGDRYDTIRFHDNKVNAKAVEFGASINNYDIVNALGEDNIRKTITEEYQKWLDEGACGEPAEAVDTFVDKYIAELNENYKRVDSSTDFRFYDDENVKVFAKDLKEYDGTTLEYIGIMPKNATLAEYVQKTSAKDLDKVIGKTKTVTLDNFEAGKVTKITGGVPLFKYNYELDLMEDLKKLGVTDIFTEEKANLSGLVEDREIAIGDASHKANIEFSNEGIKASAATQFGGAGGAGCHFEYLYDVPLVEIDLTFTDPYLYISRDKKSGEVWFIGTVYQPIENSNPIAKIINAEK